MKVHQGENVTLQWHLDCAQPPPELGAPHRHIESIGVFIAYSAGNITNVFEGDELLTRVRYYDAFLPSATLDTTDTRLTIFYNKTGYRELEDQNVWISMHLTNASFYDAGFYLVEIIFCEDRYYRCEAYHYDQNNMPADFYSFSSRGKLFLWGRYLK